MHCNNFVKKHLLIIYNDLYYKLLFSVGILSQKGFYLYLQRCITLICFYLKNTFWKKLVLKKIK